MLNLRLFGCFAFCMVVGPSCSTIVNKDSVPILRAQPNDSCLAIREMRTHGPENFFGSGPPNISSGVTAELERKVRLHNKEPRYFMKAPGKLQVVSMQGTGASQYPALMNAWLGLFDANLDARSSARTILYQMSEVPWINAGRCFHSKLRSITFPWGKAVMFLTSYVQGKTGAPVNNDMLVLVVQGFTHDGRFAVNGRFEIHHPQLPDSVEEKPTAGKRFMDLDEDSDDAEKWLDAQPDESFSPSFQDYEAFLSALEIE
ncbi:MAG: hypothetical protein ACKO8Z_00850 [Prosthecobacter sp.]